MGAIFKRELKAYFTAPIGFVVLAIFYFFASMFFSLTFASGNPDLTTLFSSLFIIVLMIIPILTMRMFSEEKRLKTDQLLYTSPVDLKQVMFGKFFAALTVYACALGITVLFELIVAFYITPDWLVFIGNFLGLLLLGGAMISIGMFISATTESQLIAAIGTFFISMVLWMLDTISTVINNEVVSTVITWISFNSRYNSFTTGTFNYADLVFFISFIAIFMFLTVRILDKKRWA